LPALRKSHRRTQQLSCRNPRSWSAQGAVIGEISSTNENIFDLQDPQENKPLYRLANKLHIRTKPQIVRQQLNLLGTVRTWSFPASPASIATRH
jgi:hypothetical protein